MLLLCAMAATLSAQIGFPGQGPFPGGGPIGGGGPLGGGRNRGGRNGQDPNNQGNQGKDSKNRNKKDAQIPTTVLGMWRAMGGAQFVAEADDHRVILFKTGSNTKAEKNNKPAELKDFVPGDHVTIEYLSDDQGYFTAVSVTFNSAGSAADQAHATQTWDLPKLDSAPANATATKPRSGDDDDDARPTLRRADGSKSGSPDDSSPKQTAQTSSGASPSKDAEPQETADNRPTTLMRPPDAPRDADDPGPPELRRGRPVQRKSSSSSDDSAATPANGRPVTVASASPNAPAPQAQPAEPVSPDQAIIPIQDDPIIAKAKEAASQYFSSLPDFFCRQVTTRYESDNPKQGWDAKDTVTADLAYENGTDSYKNVKVGSRTVKSMEDAGGNWSTGEFSVILDNLFNPGAAASFRKSGPDTINGRRADVFKFEVKRENSNWRVAVASQLYYPAYRGTVWIDKETSRVLRIEMESRGVPLAFPLAKVETAVDYDFVRLSTPDTFLLPTVAEVLACDQGSSRCTRNKIEFRNYRKFGAESDITFDAK